MANKENDLTDTDIRNLFMYLSGMKYFTEVAKSSIIITSIENSGFFPEETIKSLRITINGKAKDGFISFENFKSIWITKLDEKPSVKDVRNHFITLIDELLITNGFSQLDKNEFFLDKKILVRIILSLQMKNKEDEAILLAEELIGSIDSNQDGRVSLKDLEFLIEQYLNNISENK